MHQKRVTSIVFSVIWVLTAALLMTSSCCIFLLRQWMTELAPSASVYGEMLSFWYLHNDSDWKHGLILFFWLQSVERMKILFIQKIQICDWLWLDKYSQVADCDQFFRYHQLPFKSCTGLVWISKTGHDASPEDEDHSSVSWGTSLSVILFALFGASQRGRIYPSPIFSKLKLLSPSSVKLGERRIT